MSNSVAEAYLLILRPSGIPVLGEAVPEPYNFQIELDEWHWELVYDETADGGQGGTRSPARAPAAAAAAAFKGGDLVREVNATLINQNISQEERDRRVRLLVKKAADAQKRAENGAGSAAASPAPGQAEAGDWNKLRFTFKKNVDMASTQLLNSMKAGDVMPRAVLSLYHRSTNAPVRLTITFGKVVFTNYELSVDTSETMSDMREDWTATFKTVDYLYQNRPAAAGANFVTQGTARVFKMKLKDLF